MDTRYLFIPPIKVEVDHVGTKAARRKLKIEKLDGVAYGVMSALRVSHFVFGCKEEDDLI